MWLKREIVTFDKLQTWKPTDIVFPWFCCVSLLHLSHLQHSTSHRKTHGLRVFFCVSQGLKRLMSRITELHQEIKEVRKTDLLEVVLWPFHANLFMLSNLRCLIVRNVEKWCHLFQWWFLEEETNWRSMKLINRHELLWACCGDCGDGKWHLSPKCILSSYNHPEADSMYIFPQSQFLDSVSFGGSLNSVFLAYP